ncbi:uncharacterized protein TRIADDRAFT_57022 [Trichoplax adhaerens]|uniref:ACB domain-containing protein n=1 Tax=Trichoplax adhaerens TaxID=10228 RepID=B3S0E6_TRIAD|nr:hypothetical protein TRIADDRAFT_57022 [Trichoplax adhaerens]EDV24002.1 hypothetical protein TRIADDRAFT_57022 [Trichoplax adhaerens]|eukprot:XP_002113528.1 hypothetical protein TRIADDRAFT_57022 [Trichoplax adhaerens]
MDSNTSLNASIDINSSIGGDLTNSSLHIDVTDIQAQGKWGIPTTDAYQLALQFYHKEKASLKMSYNDKLRLIAFWKQVECGPFDHKTAPEIGYLDVIGNDRRQAWIALGSTSQEEAMIGFSDLLSGVAPKFEKWMTGIVENARQQQMKRAESIRIRLQVEQEEERRRLEEEALRQKMKQIELEKAQAQTTRGNEGNVHQDPIGESVQNLNGNAQTTTQTPSPELSHVNVRTDPSIKSEQSNTTPEIQTAAASLPQQMQGVENKITNPTPSQQQNVTVPISEKTVTELNKGDDVDNAVEPKHIMLKDIPQPSLWTRPAVHEFINQLKDDAESKLVVSRGETITIRVPTNPEGAKLYWEFATDYYDIGFGVSFEFSDPGYMPVFETDTGANMEYGDDDEYDSEDEEGYRGSGDEDDIELAGISYFAQFIRDNWESHQTFSNYNTAFEYFHRVLMNEPYQIFCEYFYYPPYSKY